MKQTSFLRMNLPEDNDRLQISILNQNFTNIDAVAQDVTNQCFELRENIFGIHSGTIRNLTFTFSNKSEYDGSIDTSSSFRRESGLLIGEFNVFMKLSYTGKEYRTDFNTGTVFASKSSIVDDSCICPVQSSSTNIGAAGTMSISIHMISVGYGFKIVLTCEVPDAIKNAGVVVTAGISTGKYILLEKNL